MKHAFILWRNISDVLNYLFLQLRELDFENGATPEFCWELKCKYMLHSSWHANTTINGDRKNET